jgi:hypothetical protein
VFTCLAKHVFSTHWPVLFFSYSELGHSAHPPYKAPISVKYAHVSSAGVELHTQPSTEVHVGTLNSHRWSTHCFVVGSWYAEYAGHTATHAPLDTEHSSETSYVQIPRESGWRLVQSSTVHVNPVEVVVGLVKSGHCATHSFLIGE